ncbi:phage/plasmid replication protein, II/X family [Sedimenticola sp.]|uniref:phage/plasmid replication protein, II/X family n=1 Tax=Sedimenticola sp. TaxID=1940285 RepID=UPI003D0DBD07
MALIDYLSLFLPREAYPAWEGWERVKQSLDRIVRFDPATGAQKWEILASEPLRSDSHQINVKVTASGILIFGSPARVQGSGCALFGTGLATRDARQSGLEMVRFVCDQWKIPMIPVIETWQCRRMDITRNFDTGSKENAIQVVNELRGTEGGRYRGDSRHATTITFNHNSQLARAIIYVKGPQLRKQMKKNTYTGLRYSADQLDQADRLVRFERRLMSQYWRENRSGKPWYTWTWKDCMAEWDKYFGRFLGSEIKVTDSNQIEKIQEAAPTPGQGRAAAATWAMIQTLGHDAVKTAMAERTWYLHKKILLAAGIGEAELQKGKLIPIYRKIVLRPVESWHDLAA